MGFNRIGREAAGVTRRMFRRRSPRVCCRPSGRPEKPLAVPAQQAVGGHQPPHGFQQAPLLFAASPAQSGAGQRAGRVGSRGGNRRIGIRGRGLGENVNEQLRLPREQRLPPELLDPGRGRLVPAQPGQQPEQSL